MGLVGNHAYSLLDVREVIARDGRTVRLLRIRNPHGVGEWNGEKNPLKVFSCCFYFWVECCCECFRECSVPG
jgi:hypothetical protein